MHHALKTHGHEDSLWTGDGDPTHIITAHKVLKRQLQIDVVPGTLLIFAVRSSSGGASISADFLTPVTADATVSASTTFWHTAVTITRISAVSIITTAWSTRILYWLVERGRCCISKYISTTYHNFQFNILIINSLFKGQFYLILFIIGQYYFSLIIKRMYYCRC